MSCTHIRVLNSCMSSTSLGGIQKTFLSHKLQLSRTHKQPYNIYKLPILIRRCCFSMLFFVKVVRWFFSQKLQGCKKWVWERREEYNGNISTGEVRRLQHSQPYLPDQPSAGGKQKQPDNRFFVVMWVQEHWK